ncbi:unnamed protein product [Parnassius mnemosyne]|uniref:Uncharacterized protein n=1 Tax=Parnassius mnemosyne TaxID=213953 RepID=A0AAV1LZN8_9NEOP
MACQPKRSETVVIHEFLAFVQQKLDVMDQVFFQDEIIQAKKMLADLAVTQIRLITRHRDGRGDESSMYQYDPEAKRQCQRFGGFKMKQCLPK